MHGAVSGWQITFLDKGAWKRVISRMCLLTEKIPGTFLDYHMLWQIRGVFAMLEMKFMAPAIPNQHFMEGSK